MVARALFAPDCPPSTATGGAGGGCSGTLDGANSCLRTKLRSADRVRNHRVCSGQARSRRHRRPRRRNQCALGARPALGHVRLFGCFVLGHRRANLDCAKAAPGILRAWVRPSIHSLCCADDCDSLRTCFDAVAPRECELDSRGWSGAFGFRSGGGDQQLPGVRRRHDCVSGRRRILKPCPRSRSARFSARSPNPGGWRTSCLGWIGPGFPCASRSLSIRIQKILQRFCRRRAGLV